MKRWTIRFLICLLLGAMLNVAVAWGFAWWYDPQRWADLWNDERSIALMGYASKEYPRWLLGLCRAPGAFMIWRTAMSEKMVMSVNPQLDLIEASDVPDWSLAKTPPTSEQVVTGSPEHSLCEIAYGWPSVTWMCAFETHRDFANGKPPVVTAMDSALPITVRKSRSGRLDKTYAFPLRPIFPGFIINTLFYALICLALLFAPGMIRRRIRSARGRCIKCGYDLRGSDESTSGGGCPECGWGRETD